MHLCEKSTFFCGKTITKSITIRWEKDIAWKIHGRQLAWCLSKSLGSAICRVQLHDGESDVRLNDGPDLNLSLDAFGGAIEVSLLIV